MKIWTWSKRSIYSPLSQFIGHYPLWVGPWGWWECQLPWPTREIMLHLVLWPQGAHWLGEQQLTWGGPVPVPRDGSDAFHCGPFLSLRHSNLWTESHPRGCRLACHGPRVKHLSSLILSPHYLFLLFNFRTFKYTTEPPVHSPKVAPQLSGKSVLSTPTARWSWFSALKDS